MSKFDFKSSCVGDSGRLEKYLKRIKWCDVFALWRSQALKQLLNGERYFRNEMPRLRSAHEIRDSVSDLYRSSALLI